MPQHVPSPLRAAVPRDAQSLPALPPQPRRIVFLAHRDLGNRSAGGSEILVDRLAEGLTSLGHQVTLVCGGPAAYHDYRVVSAGGDLGHFLRARSAFHRQVGGCDLLVEVCNGMPYLAPLWHHGPTLCLVNHVHTDLWRMRFGGPLAPAARIGRRLEHWALAARSAAICWSPSRRRRPTRCARSGCSGSASGSCTTGSRSRAPAPSARPSRCSWRWDGWSSTSGSICCCGCGNGSAPSPAAYW